MKSYLLLFILTNAISQSCAQLVINGDPKVYIKQKRATVIEEYNKRKEAIKKTNAADRSDHEFVSFERKKKNLEFKDRGSKKFPDGKPIPGNENLGTQKIDPRTPKDFGNKFMRKIHQGRRKMAKALMQDDTTFWNVTINVTINNKLYYLPISNGNFSGALSLWYQDNYHDFVRKVENIHFEEKCYLEMDTDTLTRNYVYPHCPDHCHCYEHLHECCTICQFGQIADIYECQYYKMIADAQTMIAQSIMYDRRRKRCYGRGASTSSGQILTGNSKKQKLDNPVKLGQTREHPMGGDIAISRGVF